MFRNILVTVFCSALFAQSCTAIFGGSEAADKQFPYEVVIRRRGDRGIYYYHCGGTILNNKYILTTAHCAQETPFWYKINAGTNSKVDGGMRRTVEKIIIHEDYDKQNEWNDVALLELSEPLEYSEAVQPIEIYSGDIPSGSEIVISGWGDTTTAGRASTKLKFYTATTITQEECTSKIGAKGNYSGIICLAHEVGTGVCHGDAGSPAVYNGKLVGIASFVHEVQEDAGKKLQCGGTYPDGFTKISHFQDWINSKIA